MSFLKTIKNKEGQIILEKFDSNKIINKSYNWTNTDNNFIVATVLDVETTGINSKIDQIIEIAAMQIIVDKSTGELLNLENSYSELNEPTIPISVDATRVNGITNDMVKGKRIDWEIIEQMFDKSDIIIAHNAKFDRAFLDRVLPISKNKIWGCSMLDIDWNDYGFTSKGLELLAAWHGFWYESHRGMNDVGATVHLITSKINNNRVYMSSLLNNSFKQYYQMEVSFSYNEEMIEIIKSTMGFRFNYDKKFWYKKLNLDEIEDSRTTVSMELQSVSPIIKVIEISPYDRFKI